MNDDERFDQWATSRRGEMAYRENVKWAREGWHGGIESEHARVREVCDRIEALPACRGNHVHRVEVLALVKELRQ